MDEEVAYRRMLQVWEKSDDDSNEIYINNATKPTLIMTITKAPASATKSLFSIV